MDDKVVWNIEFNVLYRTLEISGWPKLVMKLESTDSSGNKHIKGYATCVFPVTSGSHKIKCYIFRPVTSQFLGNFYGDQLKEKGKGIDAQMIASGKGRDGNGLLYSYYSGEYGICSCRYKHNA